MDKDDLDKWCTRKGKNQVNLMNASPAKLGGYKLTFNYYSKTRRGGAANIMESSGDCVYGLLAKLEKEDLDTIREKEVCPNYYSEICVDVEKFDGTVINGVKTYKVVRTLEEPRHQPPTECYLQLIIRNAEKYGFPTEYIKYLKSIEVAG